MPAVTNHDDPQTQTLAIFTLLTRLRSEWRGALILCCGLGAQGSAVALAANAAGATCLAIEPDPALCRAAMRAGACDFFVNTVDEALRVLKNEIRRRKPLAVALELNLSAALGELLERGVLPEVFTAAPACLNEETRSAVLNAAVNLQAQGTAILNLEGSLSSLAKALDASSAILADGLTPYTFVFETASALKAFDGRLGEVVPEGDFRRLWLAAAPRLFPRDRPYRRAVVLTLEERTALG